MLWEERLDRLEFYLRELQSKPSTDRRPMQTSLVRISTCPRFLVFAALALSAARPVSAQQNPDLAPYMVADRAAEVALARSATPTHVSDPHCLNPPAVRTVLPEMLKRTEWIMARVSPTEIATRTQRAYASHELSMPAVGSMAYMLSRDQYLIDGHWVPHMMFYFDKSMPPASFGAFDFKAPVIDGSVGDKQSPVWTLLIPVPQWSDGTPAAGH